MLIVDYVQAWAHVVSQPMRRIVWKTIGLTLFLLVILWAVLARTAQWGLDQWPYINQYPYAEAIAVFLAGAGLLIGIAFVIPPVSAIVAGFFLDEAAETVERRAFPSDAPGRPLPAGQALVQGVRFALLALLVNAVALLLLLVPVVNVVAFLGANAYLLSREYFELAASRFQPPSAAADLRRRHRGTVLFAGLAIAMMLAIPIVNLLTPVFGVSLMVLVHRRIIERERLGRPA